MAVSNSIDFSLTAVQIIEEARGKLGIHADEEPLEAIDLQKGLRALNMMLKGWQAEEIYISTFTEGALTLVQGDYDYVFGSGGTFTTVPFEIMDMRITRNSRDMPMVEMGRQEYFALPQKDSQGYPTQWYYDRQRSGGTLYVWPAPDSALGTLKFTYRRVIMDMDDSTNNLDLPQEWYEAVVYNLAVRLMPNNGGAGTAEAKLVIAEAARTYAVVKGFETGTGKSSLYIGPDDGH